MFSEGMCILVKCPNCGKDMEEGTLHTRNYPFWTQQELRFFRAPTDTVELGPIGDDTTSVFTRDPFPEFSHAMLCRECWNRRSFMKCPYCQQQMQEGFLSSRSPVFWSEEVSGLPLPARKGDLLLGGKLGLVVRPRAYLCRSCKTVITQYQ